jgi:uncharacterized membrane protein
MTREQLVEKIARACCEANGQEADAFLASGTEAEWTFYVVDAEAALSAIEAAGLRIVPAEPTTAQLYAGQRAWLADAERKSSTLYRAMVAASPIEPKEDSQ